MHEWHPTPSRYLPWFCLVCAFAVLAALLQMQLHAAWQWILVCGLGVFFIIDSARFWRNKRAGLSLRDGQWYLHFANQRQPARLLWTHFVDQRIGVMRLKAESGEVCTLALLPDSLSGEEFRTLAIALR